MSPSTEETGDDGNRTVAPVFSVQVQAATSSQIQESRMEAALIIHDYGRPVRSVQDITQKMVPRSTALLVQH